MRCEVTPDHRDGCYCHCRMCQLAFGDTRAAFLNLRNSELRWLSGTPACDASSKIARRGLCSRCGAPLSFEFLDGERMDLSLDSLDELGRLQPTEHFAVESRIDCWFHNDGLPCSQIDENTPIQQRWRKAYGDAVMPGLQAMPAAGTMLASPANKDLG